jgi:hypothetical protein
MGTRNRADRGSVGWLLLLAAMLTLGTLAARSRAADQAAWPPKTFSIGCWCSPPEPYITVEQYKRFAEAGFTVLLPPCQGESTVARNRKILDTARATGLKVILADARMPLALTGHPGAEAALKGIVEDYRRHPALLGYFLTDEPGANAFPGLAEVVAELHKLDPDHLVYINLFPNYASTDRTAQPSQLNTASYGEYLDKFMQTVKPDVLSWDHYFFLAGSDRPGFFGNLAAAQHAANSTQPATPFWQIVLSVKHGPYRALNENELRFEAMQTLAYGAQGLVYFTYWLPQDDASTQWSQGIMNRDGTPGPLYEAAKQVNHEVTELEKWLYGARVLRTFQTGAVPPDGLPQTDDVPITASGEGNLTLGAFRDAKGFFYALATNRDYTKGVKATLHAYAGEHKIEALDLKTGKWEPASGPKDDSGTTTLTFDLGPAQAVLIRWY